MTVNVTSTVTFTVTCGFACAARYPDIAEHLATHRRALREHIIDHLADAIEILQIVPPPSLPTAKDLARAVVTVYDGAIYQLLLDMDEAAVRKQFVALTTALVR
ncbi:hypothetical protein QSJ19_24615 [Gordonia sp. ABSL11-1]|uniref:hypothetical protein n=1 Tax=Gordonia sp. ABSL11-1 TaxID=3053924 RepID=UPI0025726D60|nr:hypothetical protein [Gordonia sp. ABSL11-1]MDL9948710.1 hypothetical protein [Gordonia sp. ABSL11-1]